MGIKDSLEQRCYGRVAGLVPCREKVDASETLFLLKFVVIFIMTTMPSYEKIRTKREDIWALGCFLSLSGLKKKIINKIFFFPLPCRVC